MTNRRKGSKSKASLSKKAESPDKQSRRLNRRSKRNRKSDSPEPPEEVGSEYSIDENTEDSDKKPVYEIEKANDESIQRESDQYESVSKAEDQKSQLREEESAGSDGSWKVKSENGNSGGIPKLKLCLTRPPEMSSPTSEQPSPRRRRRGRGNISPLKDEHHHQVEEPASEEKESPKRSTRSQKAKEILETELAAEVKKVQTLQVKESMRLEVCDSIDINHGENKEQDQEAVDSAVSVEIQKETEKSTARLQTEVEKEELDEKEIPSEKEIKTTVEQENKSLDAQEVTKETCESEDTKLQSEEIQKLEETPIEKEEQEEVKRQKRSPSRDSSEERAKEAALRSRNKYKKIEESEEGEVIESPLSEKGLKVKRSEYGDNSEISQNETRKEVKENQEESIPAKANNRKRRWGACTNRVSKKPSLSISTDFLKEIIPEVKPLAMSEVHLSPNEEEEENQVKTNEENLSSLTKKVEKEKIVQSDESEKDYEEEAVESGAEESPRNESLKAAPPVKEKEFTTFTRKVSVLPSNDLNKLQRSPSPPRHKPSNILYIVNLVRPFTIPQLRELLARTGTIAEDGFWIDKIKSRCYVKYETEEEAKTTRHALHGVRWPVSNPKQLNVDFGTEVAMKAAQEGNEILPKRPIPSLFDKQIDLKNSEKAKEKEDKNREKKEKSEKDKKDSRSKHREEEKRKEDEKEKKVRPPVEPLVRDRTVRRVTVPIREWDVGKNEDGFSPPPDGMDFGRHRDDRYDRRVEYERDKRDEYDDRRRRDKDRGRRSISNEPPRKSKKKGEEDAPAKLLDDLFRKTKATPCIYWLPLTSEQIAVKEELRRKHMAEHEKRVAELRKIQRDQNKRSSDKRRRRSKSRSRSRSTKK